MNVHKSDGNSVSILIEEIDSITFGMAFLDTTSFSTDSAGQFIDMRDNTTYRWVKIGSQIWMAENLKATKFNNNNPIPNITQSTVWANLNTPAYCWYDNQSSYGDMYGALYNWYAVNTNDLCPIGWHVPSNLEWDILENFLIKNRYNFDGSTNSNKIAKALATATVWPRSETVGSVGNTDYPYFRNATGFSALPGGLIYSGGIFVRFGIEGNWWTSSSFDFENAYSRLLSYASVNLYKYDYFNKKYGFSVRCIKD